MVRLDTGKDRSSYAEGSLAIQIQINGKTPSQASLRLLLGGKQP